MEQVLVGALIAGAFALGGVVYGKRSEREHWRRDRRLDAYVEFLREADTTWLHAMEWSQVEIEDEAMRLAHRERTEVMLGARGRIEVLGPASVSKAAIDLGGAAGRAWRVKGNLPAPGARDIKRQRDAFIAEARNVLWR